MDHKEKITLRILNEENQNQLHDILKNIEGDLRIDTIGDILYSLLNELITNAVKANMKRAYFAKNGYSYNDAESYKEGSERFKHIFTMLYKDAKYYRALEELDLSISVEIDVDQDRLLIYVENNVVLMPEEEKRIREKLASAMNVNDLVQFSVLYGDDMEGEGLGLAMVVQLIKYIGFDPEHFRVYRKGKRTVARVEFPLNKDYTPIRDRFNPHN